ncbi:MAG: hypothetical protein ACI4PG_06580 [Candidatus Ventricola sp.]
MTDAALASHTPIGDFLRMPIALFAEFYAAIAEALERQHKQD